MGSSSRTGSDNGDGEKEMPSLDIILEGMDGTAASEEDALDKIIEGTGAIQLETAGET